MTTAVVTLAIALAAVDADVRLMRAIRMVESGGDYQAKGDWRYVDAKAQMVQVRGVRTTNTVPLRSRVRSRLVPGMLFAGTKRQMPRVPTSWGAYQFGRARWSESGGNPADWGRARQAEQDRIMRRALANYRRQAGPRWARWSERERVTWCANAHNQGHGSLRETEYVKKIRRELKRCRRPTAEEAKE